MPGLVLAVGALVTAISLFLMVRTEAMAGMLDKVFGTNWVYAAALGRLLLGAALIGSAQTVRFPGAVALFGWLFVLGGLTLVVIPQPALLRMAGWFGRLSPTGARLWLTGAVLFGLFLVYVALP